MKGWLLALLLCAGAAGAQEDFRWVEFHFARPGLPVAEYTFHVDESGKGFYKAENVSVVSANKYSMTAAAGGESRQQLELNDAMKARIFELLNATHGLAHCDAHHKGIADTGAKSLTIHEAYQTTPGATCSYNYSEDKAVVELTGLFQGMAATLDAARKMTRDEQYDRLALDADMIQLVSEVKGGQALGLSNIRGVLQGLVDDPAVLERVRVQAGKLLEQSVVTL